MSQCKLTKVARARISPGKCEKCHSPIGVGDPYRWWKGRYTPKHVRCMRAGCTPDAADLETNPLRADGIRFETAVSDAQGHDTEPAAAASSLRDALALAESIIDELDSRIGNMEGTNLEYTSTYETLESTREAFDDWRSGHEDIADELEAFAVEPEEDDFLGKPEYINDDDARNNFGAAYDEWSGSLAEKLNEIEDAPELDLGA